MTRKHCRGITLRQKRAITGLVFISPWLFGAFWFFSRNILTTVYYSFCKITMGIGSIGLKTEFIKLRNYWTLFFVNENFNRMLAETISNLLVNVPLIIFFSLFMAMILNQKFKGRGLVRIIFFLPVIMASGSVAAAFASGIEKLSIGMQTLPKGMTIGKNMFDSSSIVLLLLDYGLPAKIANYILGALTYIYDVITASGVQILIFLAALQSVPRSMYEVAQIEGATAYESFWKITLPMVSPLILTNIVYTIVDSYDGSALVKYAYDTAFTGSMEFGLSATISLISSVTVCLLLLLISYLLSKVVFYQNA